MRAIVLSTVLALCSTAEASWVNYQTHEINVKVVYYGPPASATSRNVQYIYDRIPKEAKGPLSSLKPGSEPTLFFDYVPPGLGMIHGFQTRFHLYSAPTTLEDGKSRELVLKGADGIVFIADSDPARQEATLTAWKELQRYLEKQGLEPSQVLTTVQLDHHERPHALSVDAVKRLLGLTDQPVVAADSATGSGLFETLKSVAKQLLHELIEGAAAKSGHAP